MRIGDMQHRILFLCPGGTDQNAMFEDTPLWIPMDPKGGAVSSPPFTLSNDCVRIDVSELGLKLKQALIRYGVWAHVSPMTGREYEESQKIRAETTYKIKVRYFPHLTSELRILFRDKIFRIESVLETDMSRREVQLVCTEEDDYGKKAG